MQFRALQPGELLVFRLKSPRNKIGGFGVFSNHSLLPVQIAWDSFGRANGVSSFEALRSAIAGYRTGNPVGPMTNIGCTILVEPVFFPSDLWFDVPQSWSRSIQRGKVYSTDDSEGLKLWNQLHDAAQMSRATVPSEIADVVQARYGTPTLVTPRLGQGAFRVAVTEAYGRQCAVTVGKSFRPSMPLISGPTAKVDTIQNQTAFCSGRTFTAYSTRDTQRLMQTIGS